MEPIPSKHYDNILLDQMKNIIRFASESNGWVFKNYVRDVIFDKQHGDTPNRVDLYFKYQSEFSSFMKMCSDNGFRFIPMKMEAEQYTRIGLPRQTIGPSCTSYSMFNNIYLVHSPGTFTFIVDVSVCDVLPVDDFDINNLTYRYDSNGKWIMSYRASKGHDSIGRNVLENLLEKKVYIESRYLQDHRVLDMDKIEMKFAEIKNNFLDKGWRVFYYKRLDMILPPVLKEISPTVCINDFCSLFFPVLNSPCSCKHSSNSIKSKHSCESKVTPMSKDVSAIDSLELCLNQIKKRIGESESQVEKAIRLNELIRTICVVGDSLHLEYIDALIEEITRVSKVGHQ